MFQAYARVVTPEYQYWNPIPGAIGATPEAALAAIPAICAERWPNLSAWRVERMRDEGKAFPIRA